MKKISFYVFILACLLAFQGCLKDKDFNNHVYGINNPGNQPPGVGFPLASKAKTTVGIDAGSSVTQVINGIIFVNLESGFTAKSDVHIKLTLNNSLVTAYNTANGSNILVLPAAQYTIPTLDLVIPAGQRFIMVPINILNTTSLSPANTYAIGLTITSVDGGYRIAENLKNLLTEFALKNKYDGKYSLKGYFSHPSYMGYYKDIDVQLHTQGSNSVAVFWTEGDDYIKPFSTNGAGGGINGFGDPGPDPTFVVDESTNKVTGFNYYGQGAYPYLIIFDPAYDSRYDPATKTFFVKYGYRIPDRLWTDTFTYKGPR